MRQTNAMAAGAVSAGRAMVMSPAALVEVSPDHYEWVVGGTADVELVDIAEDGVYVLVDAGTAPTAPRLRGHRIPGNTIAVF